ncbi:hypothetical protein ACLB2K_047310 [Fragaria x ananassa]
MTIHPYLPPIVAAELCGPGAGVMGLVKSSKPPRPDLVALESLEPDSVGLEASVVESVTLEAGLEASGLEAVGPAAGPEEDEEDPTVIAIFCLFTQCLPIVQTKYLSWGIKLDHILSTC